MFGKARRIAPLLRSLLLGTVTLSAAVISTGTLIACEDESVPETYVSRLDDKLQRNAAVKRLIQFYEDAMTKDKKNREGEHVKKLLDVIVEPLSKVAESAELDDATQGELLRFLADTRDKRAVAALVKALDAYRIDDKRAESIDAHMGDVVRGLGEMKAKEAAPALLKLFKNMHASWPKAQNKLFYRIVAEAMDKLVDPAWESDLIALLKTDIKTLDNKKQRQVIDQVYWQATAAKLLGAMHSKKAVRPLIKVVLSPFKRNVHTTAISALIKIGKPSIDDGVKLLNGEDQELMDYAAAEFLRSAEDQKQKITDAMKKQAKTVYLQSATLVVANVGRAECTDPMLAAIDKGDPATKAIIANELHKLPADKKINDKFLAVLDKTSPTLNTPLGNAMETLTRTTGSFFDPDLAMQVAEKAAKMKGEDAAYAQAAAIEMLMKVARKKDWAMVETLSNKPITYPKKSTVGKGYEKELKALKAALDECGDEMACWEKKLTAGASQQKKNQIVGIKAGYMMAILGGDAARKKLADAVPRISNDAIRFVAISAIDRLSPKGDKAIADQFQALIDKAVANRDTAKLKKLEPLKTVIYRLQARL